MGKNTDSVCLTMIVALLAISALPFLVMKPDHQEYYFNLAYFGITSRILISAIFLEMRGNSSEGKESTLIAWVLNILLVIVIFVYIKEAKNEVAAIRSGILAIIAIEATWPLVIWLNTPIKKNK